MYSLTKKRAAQRVALYMVLILKVVKLNPFEARPLGRVDTYYPKLAVGEVKNSQLKELKEISLYLKNDKNGKKVLYFLDVEEKVASQPKGLGMVKSLAH